MSRNIMKTISKKLISEWSTKKPLYIKKTDKRYARYVKQLKTNGFCDVETWGLDSVIAQFILPRLIRFKEINIGYPIDLTFEQWNTTLDEIIFAFEWSLHNEDKQYNTLTIEQRKQNWNRYYKGMKEFAKHFRELWW